MRVEDARGDRSAVIVFRDRSMIAYKINDKRRLGTSQAL